MVTAKVQGAGWPHPFSPDVTKRSVRAKTSFLMRAWHLPGVLEVRF